MTATSVPEPAITRRSCRGPAPLSFPQEQLFLTAQTLPAAAVAAYDIPALFRVRRTLDERLLRSALERIVARHEILRTRIDLVDGVAVQRVLEPPEFELPVLDLRELPLRERRRRAEAFLTDLGRRPFDPSDDLLLRAALIHMAPADDRLLLVLHHSASDRDSRRLLLRELDATYKALAAGSEPVLPELPIQYADFAQWQRQALGGRRMRELLDYWTDQLAGAPEQLDLPTDHPRPAALSYRGALRTFSLSADTSDRIRDFARRERATTFMVLLAAFNALLHRYCATDDLVVGTPVSLRGRPEVANLLGFFTNTVALRSRVSGDPSFAEMVAAAKVTAIEAHAHHELPFSKLVEALNPPRSESHAPIFPVLFNFDRLDGERPSLAGCPLEQLPVPGWEWSRYDLSLVTRERADGSIYGRAEFASDLWEPASVERLLEAYVRLLEGALEAPDTPLSRLPLLAEAERRALLAPAPEREYPRACVHELIAETAARHADRVAVQCGTHTLTYADLLARAARLAHRLRALGVGPETLVGVCLERSLDLPVALLAVWQAGAAYVPIDPAYPPARQQLMLEDSGARVLITQQSLLDRVPQSTTAHLLCLDREEPELETLPAHPPALPSDPERLAYVIYTSGSTGRPKGVEIGHRSLTNLLWAMRQEPGLTPEDVLVAVTTLSFDIAALELFVPLLVGARVVVASAEEASDPSLLAGLLSRVGATTMQATPLRWQALLEQAWRAPAGFRALCGGEPLPASLAARLLESGVELWNLYGPTETTIWSTAAPLSKDAPVTIGRPIANTSVYVLDPNMEPVPIGVAGELWIGGHGLARGYLGQPTLTAERFLPNPFTPGERLYRTGDLARWRHDGQLDFLGRVDHQVKLRGYRIELGEIEQALRGHPGVRAAAVTIRGQGPDSQLVAYVVPAGEPPTARALRSHLAGMLPDYMLPAAYVTLETFPQTPNGKVDRRALPAPDLDGDAAAADAYTPPGTKLERELVGVWEELLGLPRIGVGDNFFALGGHSLLAVRLVSRVRDVVGVELPVAAVFTAPTVADLAAAIDTSRATVASAAIPSRPRSARRLEGEPDEVSVFPASAAQRQLWFLDQLDTRGGSYDVPQLARVHGELDLGALERALAMLVARHETLRTTFRMIDGTLYQVVHPPRAVGIEVTDVTHREDRERAAWAVVRERRAQRFDLTRGPLLRASAVRLSDREHALMLIVHHTVTDEWSQKVMARELAACYEAARSGREPALPPMSIQYADFAIWQNELIERGALTAQLDYWRDRLADAPARLDLPFDRPRPARQSFRGGACERQLTPDLSARLERLARREGATAFMTSLAAFVALLHRYSGQSDLVVSTPIANRDRSELEGLIGFVVNTVALRSRLDGDPSFSALLSQIRATTLEALANQDIPFERVIAAVNPERHPSHQPLAQVMFSYSDAEAIALGLPGLEASRLRLPHRTAKFDLTMIVTNTAEGLRLTLEFASDLWEPASVERLLEAYVRLLEGALEAPDTPLSRLPLLAEAERRALLAPAPEREYPRACVHELIAETAARHADRVAVQCGTHTLTYADLLARAARLAHRLRALGVGPETLVGVCLERSLDLPVALLAVWQAGAAYVPIDPAYPPARQQLMLEDSGARVLITQQSLLDRVPQSTTAHLLCLDREEPELETLPAHPPALPSDPERLAYVIYTSGSTGRPKGVEIGHRSLTNLLWAMRQEPGLTPEDTWLGVASISFDVAALDLYLPLLTGARCILATGDELRDPAQLATLLDRRRPTVFNATPSRWQALLDAGWKPPARLTGLCGAEPLPQALADRLLEQGVTMWNQYGPTEATVNATQACLRSPLDPVTIGRPIANTSVYVLDPNMEPVPIGVAGELWIGGHGLARGYLGQPTLTAERFLPNPFTPGERLYRTGDLARWRHDGQLDFLGRVDHQVKLRGYRIELGEIEHALTSHPGVARAVVARRGQGSEAALVAYFTSHHEPPAPADLRTHLANTLPDYMLPAAYVALEAFPLTPSGKLDRGALPAPGGDARASRAFAPPTSDVERALMPLWQRLLGISDIGIDDDFFAVGGHSLLAVQLVHAIEDELDRACTIAMLMRNRTIRTLARELEVGGADATEPALIQLADGQGAPVFCICGVHAYQELAEQLAPDHPVYGIFLPVEQQTLRSHRRPAGATDLSVEAMASAYRAMVRERQPSGPYLLLGFCFGAVLAYELAQQLIDEGDAVQLLTMLDPPLGEGIAGPGRRLASRAKARMLSSCEHLPRAVQRRLLGERWVDETARLDRLRGTIYGDALRRYSMRPYDGEVLVVEAEGSGADDDGARDSALLRTIASAAVHRVEGGHVAHLRRPYVHRVAELIRTHVDGQPD